MVVTITSNTFYCRQQYISSTGRNAVLVGNDGFQVYVPLLSLVAASRLVEASTVGRCDCEDVVIILPEFSSKTIELFVRYICGEDVYADYNDVVCLGELCRAFLVDVVFDGNETICVQQKLAAVADVEIEENSCDGFVKDNANFEFVAISPKRDQLYSEELEIDNDFTTIEALPTCEREDGTAQMCGNERFQCTMCDKHYSQKGELTRHMRSHTGDKLFECQFCPVKFLKLNDLTRHKRIHKGERPFECAICLRRFIRKTHLSRHILTHSKEKPYECSDCQMKFADRHILKQHKLLHGSENPFRCGTCSKCFTAKGALIRHVRTHRAGNQYECPYCKKRCIQKSDLDIHIRKHTGEKPFQCNSCKKSFTMKKSLVAHSRKCNAS